MSTFKANAQHKKAKKIAAHIFGNILSPAGRRDFGSLRWVKGWSPEYRAEMAAEAGQHLASDDSWDLVVTKVKHLIDEWRDRAAQPSEARGAGAPPSAESVPAPVR